MSDMRYTLRAVVKLALLAGLASGQGVLSVRGDVPSPLKLSLDDLAMMKRSSVSIDSNGTKTVYEGVALGEVLRKAGAPSGEELRGKKLASYVLAKAKDGYQVVFTLAEVDAEFANQQILLADKRDGKPLPDNQGPLRLICPQDKAQARSVRMLESLEVVHLLK